MGGVENYVDGLTAELASRGHEVTIICNNHSPSLPTQEIDGSGRRILRLDSHLFMNGRFPLIKQNKTNRSIFKRINDAAIDAVIINTRYYPISRKTAFLVNKKGIEPLLIDHSSSWLAVGSNPTDTAIRSYEKLANSLIKSKRIRYFCVSSKGIDWLKELGINAEGVLFNAVNASSFIDDSSHRDFRTELSIPSETPLVIFTGRLLPEKGIWTLRDAAAALSDSGIHFAVAGEGPEKDALEQRAPSNMHLVGKLSRPDVAALLEQGDVFCFPSYYPEGFPTSLIEAAVAKCAIISADNGGVADLLPDSSYGMILSNKPTAEETASAIKAVISNNLIDVEKTAQRSEEVFSWSHTADRLLAAVQK